ncbi:hypothetical protein [Fodinibius halophilus]|uniref:Uncharacterized protein n=1 Tax=Fodinibius halophilus TaxID=1736908 RepID=A0A6M1T825_9BACT|nr:hypothetical protein [Fodinibius halophilus]NGP90229.1 hypothetical protein [Fodinibius halophilus]
MPYLEIENYPIFLTQDRERFLVQELFDDPSKRVATELAGSPEREEYVEKTKKYLEAEFKKDKKSFLKEWFNFKLIEQEARVNLYNILVDYSYYYNQSFLQDIRSGQEKILQDRLGDSLNFPLGNSFYFCIKEKQNFFDKLFSTNSVESRILINSNNTYKIEGNLKSFTLYMGGMALLLSDKISIIPTKDLKTAN